jgi:hypothetical protein
MLLYACDHAISGEINLAKNGTECEIFVYFLDYPFPGLPIHKVRSI